MPAYTLNPSDVEVLKKLFRFCRKYSLNLSREPLPEVYSLTFDAFCNDRPEMVLDETFQDHQSPNYFGTYYVNKVAIHEPTQRGKIFLFEDRIASVNDLFNIGYGDVSMFRNVLLLQFAAEYVLHTKFQYGYSHLSSRVRMGFARFIAMACFKSDVHYFYLQNLTPLVENKTWSLQNKQNLEAVNTEHAGGFYTKFIGMSYEGFTKKMVELKNGFWLNETSMVEFLLSEHQSIIAYLHYKGLACPNVLVSEILLNDVMALHPSYSDTYIVDFHKVFRGNYLMLSRFIDNPNPNPQDKIGFFFLNIKH